MLREDQKESIDIPKLKELSVLNISTIVKEIDYISQFFSDFNENELPDRTYMWNVLNTQN